MGAPMMSGNDAARVDALQKYAILDSEPEQAFDDLTPRNLAADQEAALKALSRLVLMQMEFRRNLILLKEALNDRTREEHELERELKKVQDQLLRVLRLQP